VLVLVALAAFSFGAIVQVASAGHYHVNCNSHGFVHGGSNYDSAYHSRVEGLPCRDPSSCDVGQFGRRIKYGTSQQPGVTCDTFLTGYGPECDGNAWTELFTRFGYHRHDAHC